MDQATERLLQAIRECDTPGVEQAIKAGADINAQDSIGWTAIHFAVCTRDKNLVELLLEKSVNLDLCSVNGRTPLSFVGEDETSEEIKKMIRAYQNKKVLHPLP